jgi:hypothetical protein
VVNHNTLLTHYNFQCNLNIRHKNIALKNIIVITPGEWNEVFEGMTRQAALQIHALIKYLINHAHIGKSFSVSVLRDAHLNTEHTAELIIGHLEKKFPDAVQNTALPGRYIEGYDPLSFAVLEKKLAERLGDGYETTIVVMSQYNANILANEQFQKFVKMGNTTNNPLDVAGFIITPEKKHIECIYSQYENPEYVIAE